ncbi:MAG TPA: DUF882 domain-containing protein [Gammaproteobacteria bacterium]|nr:DUF882 domain-containing protein [Gammaproteobacteria bacterium]
MLESRRRFVLASLGAAAGLCPVARAVAAAAAPAVHRLSFYHIHTGEKLSLAYREQGEPIPAALTEINRYLRDFRTEQVHDIDVKLLDALHELFTTFDGRGNFEVISGYRSPRTNAALRHATTGVAENSLHLQGRAIDVRLTSAKTVALRDAAIKLRSGGVGYYAESNFVHLDTGAFRTW